MVFNQDNRLSASQVAKRDPQKFTHSLAVARVFHHGKKTSATAFRVGSGNLMMTNAHVLLPGNPRQLSVEFTDRAGRVTRVNGDTLLAVGTDYKNSNAHPSTGDAQYLDFALFTINPAQFPRVQKFGYLELDPGGAKPGQQIYIPQYGKIGKDILKTFALTDDARGREQPSRINRVYRDSDLAPRDHHTNVQYTADTSGGASGSPVISADTNKVIALHNGQNEHTNIATNISSILPWIKGFLSGSTAKRMPVTPTRSPAQHQQVRQYQVGERRYHNGDLQEWWQNPSGGQRWVDVWQSKHYAVGHLVVKDGAAYAYLGDTTKDASQWAPVFDPNQDYSPDQQVYYYGRIVEVGSLSQDRARPARSTPM
ncbi:serine protease [Herbaspirillum sp. YR522]|uniref:trypsin-like serine peptidase n=1 Tax=Herbaspirillum sp. YR522 TaxID=1144342 RepID=UPI00026F4B2C|nr:serine protease [Herbaspirillum sp. YR522]EJM97473.1 hypothetical protein PMI40_04355 [Herbaspirillum sp. YR522]